MTTPTTTARELALECANILIATYDLDDNPKDWAAKIEAAIDSALGPLVADRERLNWLDAIIRNEGGYVATGYEDSELADFEFGGRPTITVAEVSTRAAIDAAKNAGKGA